MKITTICEKMNDKVLISLMSSIRSTVSQKNSISNPGSLTFTISEVSNYFSYGKKSQNRHNEKRF